MFGTYRFILAIIVTYQHLTAGVLVLGEYAVFGFYTLSGYLMTFVMQNVYGYSGKGKLSYGANRFLRVFPQYWFTCIVSLVLIAILGEAETKNFHWALFWPEGWEAILRNFFMIHLIDVAPRLVAPTWAVTVEIVFYILMGLGLSKSRIGTTVWFTCSLIYMVTMITMEMGTDYTYFSILAGSLPVATGAMVYHYKDQLTQPIQGFVKNPYSPALMFFIILGNWVVSVPMGTGRSISLLLNIFLIGLFIIVMADRRSTRFISKKLDILLGDLTYPMFLMHMNIGMVVFITANRFGYPLDRYDLKLTLITLPILVLVALAMTYGIERPIEMIRKSLKPVPDKT